MDTSKMKKEELTLPDAMKYPKSLIVREYPNKSTINYNNIFSFIWNVGQSSVVYISDCRLVLRSLDQLTEEEILEIGKIIVNDNREFLDLDTILVQMKQVRIADYLRSRNIDIDGFLLNGKAVKNET